LCGLNNIKESTQLMQQMTEEAEDLRSEIVDKKAQIKSLEDDLGTANKELTTLIRELEKVERPFVELWRRFAADHINDAGMTGAESEALTNAAFDQDVSDRVVDRIRQIAVNHQLIENWML
jgi:chromosome segregation ATPase